MKATCWSWKEEVERPGPSSLLFDWLLLLLNPFKLLTSRYMMLLAIY